MQDLRQGPPDTPIAQLTAFGWVISGPNGDAQSASVKASVLTCVLAPDTDTLLRKFWEDESIAQASILLQEKIQCKNHFINTHSRSKKGRYIVRLPFKEIPRANIGESLPIAELLYTKLKNKLRLRPAIRDQYQKNLARIPFTWSYESSQPERKL